MGQLVSEISQGADRFGELWGGQGWGKRRTELLSSPSSGQAGQAQGRPQAYDPAYWKPKGIPGRAPPHHLDPAGLTPLPAWEHPLSGSRAGTPGQD